MVENKQLENIHAMRADYYPLLSGLMQEIDLVGTINRIVEPLDTQANIDIGTYVALFIHHVLGDVNIKMYRMDEFFKDKALPLLIPWNPTVQLSDINDDRAARVLDALWKANPQHVFSAIASAAISVHSIPTDTVHADTTSMSFEGAYEEGSEDERVPKVKFGFSKDLRPDLKQLVFGVGVTDGVPTIGEIANGNESDMTLDGRWVKNLRKMMQKDEDESLLYIADSSLITTDNLRIRQTAHVDIISRLPGRFEIEDDLKRKAIFANNWEPVGKLSEVKGSASYKVWETNGEIDGYSYRFVVVHSDHKGARKLKTLEKEVKREFEAHSKRVQKLFHRRFACSEDANIESTKYLSSYPMKYHRVEWEVEEHKEAIKRSNRGRPKIDELPQFQTNYYLKGKLRLNEETVNTEREHGGLFVLITTLKDGDKYPARKILEQYKGQGNVERIFRFIKNPAWIGAFCLKKEERLAALGYVLLMAAVIYTLWERRVRKALSQIGAMPIEGLNRQKTLKPTAYALETVMSGLLVLCRTHKMEMSIWLSYPLTHNQKRVVELSGFSPDIYEGHWRIAKKRE